MSNTHQPQLDATDQALIKLTRAVRDTGYHFTTVTPATHERVLNRIENRQACDLRGVFGWSLPFQRDVLTPQIWELMQESDVVARHGEIWRSTVRLSSLNEQLFLHSSYPTTDADAVFFGPDTYRFAMAIESYFKSNSREINKVVDVGCGAGPGAISVALARPHASVTAVDINQAALRFTRLNAVLALAANVEARLSNLLSDVEGSFDLIVANPPYLVDPSERAYRHGGGPLGAGLALAIVDAALERLAPAGSLLLYTGVAMINGEDPFQNAVQEKLKSADVRWTYREMDPDVFGEELESETYANADRIAAVVLEVTKTAL